MLLLWFFTHANIVDSSNHLMWILSYLVVVVYADVRVYTVRICFGFFSSSQLQKKQTKFFILYICVCCDSIIIHFDSIIITRIINFLVSYHHFIQNFWIFSVCACVCVYVEFFYFVNTVKLFFCSLLLLLLLLYTFFLLLLVCILQLLFPKIIVLYIIDPNSPAHLTATFTGFFCCLFVCLCFVFSFHHQRLNFLFLFPVFLFYFLVIDLNESNEFIDHQYEKDKLKKKILMVPNTVDNGQKNFFNQSISHSLMYYDYVVEKNIRRSVRKKDT